MLQFFFFLCVYDVFVVVLIWSLSLLFCGASVGLCFLIGAFPGYIHIYVSMFVCKVVHLCRCVLSLLCSSFFGLLWDGDLNQPSN